PAAEEAGRGGGGERRRRPVVRAGSRRPRRGVLDGELGVRSDGGMGGRRRGLRLGSSATLPRLLRPVGPRPHAMSYAIISIGGKQYRVHEGEKLLVDRLATEPGKTFTPAVLLLGGDGDTDLKPSATVTAKVVDHVLGDKI